MPTLKPIDPTLVLTGDDVVTIVNPRSFQNCSLERKETIGALRFLKNVSPSLFAVACSAAEWKGVDLGQTGVVAHAKEFLRMRRGDERAVELVAQRLDTKLRVDGDETSRANLFDMSTTEQNIRTSLVRFLQKHVQANTAFKLKRNLVISIFWKPILLPIQHSLPAKHFAEIFEGLIPEHEFRWWNSDKGFADQVEKLIHETLYPRPLLPAETPTRDRKQSFTKSREPYLDFLASCNLKASEIVYFHSNTLSRIIIYPSAHPYHSNFFDTVTHILKCEVKRNKQTCDERFEELVRLLESHGLAFNDASQFCQDYIQGETGEDIEEVVAKEIISNVIISECGRHYGTDDLKAEWMTRLEDKCMELPFVNVRDPFTETYIRKPAWITVAKEILASPRFQREVRKAALRFMAAQDCYHKKEEEEEDLELKMEYERDDSYSSYRYQEYDELYNY
ncbi:hypothetical protein HDV05_001590 [Chytridiales sp. JEL 0842]|nr:hypothetical protein HDV05_001590 [Chytridiales sp. JEL 0842]